MEKNLVESRKSRWSFAKGRQIWMINCKRPAHPDDHLRKASQSRWSFAKGQPMGMIICKRLAHPDDHLQRACPCGWSIAKDWPIRMITCKRPALPDDHLQRAGPSRWSIAKGWQKSRITVCQNRLNSNSQISTWNRIRLVQTIHIGHHKMPPQLRSTFPMLRRDKWNSWFPVYIYHYNIYFVHI